MNAGACLCGALRYEVEGPFNNLMHCHCSMCRKHHGAPFATFVGASSKGFRWISGEDAVQEYPSSPSGKRRFCGVCGAVAPTVMGDSVFMPAGNLVGEIGDAGGMHVFVGSKAPWHVIADDLPQYQDVPPGWSVPDVQRPKPPVLEGATHGSCLCGDVSFSVRGAPARWMQCHCSRCRRGRSAAHGSNTFYPVAQFAWRSGREQVRTYKLPEAERFSVSFCVRCGGGAPVERAGVPFVLVPAALFDADPGARPEAHIHVASKAPWYTIRDAIPQFAELPPP
ncbi:MAG: GFA family protein [Myxococcota bacterium]